MNDLIMEIQKTKVTPHQLRRALLALESMKPSERSDITARALTFLRLFQSKNRKTTERYLLLAVENRLRVLARLSERSEFGAWSISSGINTMKYINPKILNIVATEPLLFENGDLMFDPDHFFSRLLKAEKPSGLG